MMGNTPGLKFVGQDGGKATSDADFVPGMFPSREQLVETKIPEKIVAPVHHIG
jgi:hypothetical protein